MEKMKIGVLGSGDVGQVLGRGLIGIGHEVMIGTRNPYSEKVQAWVHSAGAGASAGTFAQTADFGEVLVLATLWSGTEDVVRLMGPERAAGKVVIDATNPLQFRPDGPPVLSPSGQDSAGEQVQRWLPGARVVKAFNTVGNPHMVNPQFPGGPPDMFIAGNDDAAKALVTGICEAFGWGVVDLGPIEASRYLEPLAMVWITHYFRTQKGNHAFKLLRK